MDWCRLWHELPTDPKWRVIAKKTGEPVASIIAVYVYLLVNASCNAMKRGETHGIVSEDIAAALDIAETAVRQILEAMQGKVLAGEKLTGWEKRQPKRERNEQLSTPRVNEFRKRKRLATPCNTEKHLEEIRLEENIKETTLCETSVLKQSASQPERPILEQEFEEDWPQFWARIGKAAAKKAYRGARRVVPRGELMQSVRSQGPRILQRASDTGSQVLHPATWLNQGRWSDEDVSLPSPSTRRPPPLFEPQRKGIPAGQIE